MNITEVPLISKVPLDGRAVLLQPWFDGTSWHFYAETGPGALIHMPINGMDSGAYYATAPVRPSDLHFPFGTLIAQHLSFPPVARQMFSLVEDVHLLAASLEKLELLGEGPRNQRGLKFLVETEVEYLFILVRAMYDVLHNVVREIARLLCTPEGRPIVQDLPGSFADMVLKGNPSVHRSAADLVQKYGLPKTLADCYVAQVDRFDKIRSIRVGIEHYGRRVPSVYITERGFAMHAKEKGPWSELEVWQGHELLPNDLGSVRALAAFLAKSFLETVDGFCQALRQVIDPRLLPAAVFSDVEVYITNPCIERLSTLGAVLASPWIDTTSR